MTHFSSFRLSFSFISLTLLACSFVHAGNTNKIIFGPNIVSYTITDDNLSVHIQSPNPGWIALGFGDSMINSDIVSLRLDGTDVIVEDRWSTFRSVPSLDQQQDWKLVSGSYTANQWDVTIIRKLSTDDTYDTVIRCGMRYNTLFAIGVDMSFTSKHKFFWELESIKYSEDALIDQEGAVSILSSYCLLLTLLAVFLL